MCTYNGARYLPDQLASISSQTRLPDEVIICDDASGDETLTIIRSFAATSPFPVKVVANPIRLGSTRNFDQAINLSQGDLIFLSDQDDIWAAEKLAVVEELFINKPEVGLVFTDGELIDDKGASLGHSLWEAYRFDSTCKQKIQCAAYELLDRREVVTGATMAFRAKFKDLIRPIPEDLPVIHDGWIALMIAHAGKLDFIEEPLIKYRQHSSQQLGAPLDPGKPESRLNQFTESIRRSTDFGLELRKVQAVLQRMNAVSDRYAFIGKKNLDKLLLHFQTREAITRTKLANVPAMLRELFAGRYHRYSNGLSSMVKDILR